MAEVISFGCRLNHAESAAIRTMTADADDLVVVNGCAVTAEAMRDARRAVRRVRRERPNARIAVTGCAAQVDPAGFAAMPEVDRVLGQAEKRDATAFLPDEGLRVRVADVARIGETTPHLVAASTEGSRAFVEVQNGCDHACTFCIIPAGRGSARSAPAGPVVERIARAVDEGCREVVLTGVDLTSDGPDLPGAPSLGRLIERILAACPALPRLRLSSLDAVEIDERLFELLAHEPRLMPHLHLSLQSGDDLILKRMRRRHGRSHAIELVQRLKARRPELAIGADLIAGFPTETSAAHANSMALLDEADVVMAHVFPFSPRPGTPAARMPQLDPMLVRARAAELRAAASVRADRWKRSLADTQARVLVERNGTGHGENFARVALRSGRLPGTIAQVTLGGVRADGLIEEVE